MSLNSSAGAINIGNDAVAQAINVGTGAAARTITVGNVSGATAVNVNSGTGGATIASTGAGDITVNSDDTLLLDADGVLELNSSAGAISIGNDDIDQAINIGTQGERTINIGSSSATAVDFGASPIEDYTASIGTTISSARDLAATDNGKILVCDAGFELSIPEDLPVGFNCLIVQYSSTDSHYVIIGPKTGSVNIYNNNGHDRTQGRYAVMSVLCITSNTYVTSGDGRDGA
jgi:hypothetical protein